VEKRKRKEKKKPVCLVTAADTFTYCGWGGRNRICETGGGRRDATSQQIRLREHQTKQQAAAKESTTGKRRVS